MNKPQRKSPATVLSIDAGSQSVRVGLYSAEGERLGCWQRACVDEASGGLHVEQDAASIVAAVRWCLEQVPVGSQVTAAALVSQGASLVCWNHVDGQALSPVISWQDRRGEPYVERLAMTNDQVHALTGLPLSSHYGASKLRWCLDELACVRDAARDKTLVGGPLVSYLLHHLCSEHPRLTDSGNASRTQLWDLQGQRWDRVLTEQFGIPAEVLPEGAVNLSDFGHLEVAGERVPLVMVNRDQQAALFAAGRPDPSTAYVNLGTGAFIQCLVAEPTGPPELLLNRVLSGDTHKPPLWSLEGTVHGAAGATPWIERELGFAVTPEMLRNALATEPERNKPIYFINGVMGMGSPYWRSEGGSRFSPQLSDQEKLLAWLESVVFMLVENLRAMSAHVAVSRIRCSGGWSHLSGLVQRLADLSGLACECSDDHEATLRGAAFLATGGAADWQCDAGERYLPRENPGLVERYRQWQQAMSETP